MVHKVIFSVLLVMCFVMASGQAPRMVQVNVVAVDNHGAPITDLKSDDFQVSDGGRPQHIAFFHHEVTRTRAVPLAAGEFSNRAGVSVAPTTAILFDLLNSGFDRNLTAREILKALPHVEVPDHVFVYFLDKNGKLIPIRGVPPATDLAATANPWAPEFAGVLDAALAKAAQVRQQDLRLTSGYVLTTFSVLGQLAAQLTVLPGPRNIVWLTHGVPITLRGENHEFNDFTPKVRQFAAELARANVAVTPVKTVLGEEAAERTTMDLFADLTGGRAYMSNEVEPAIVQATQNARAAYRIGYYPAPQEWDGKYHKVKVTTTRHDVRIQAAEGYTADPSPDQANRDEMAAVDHARLSPVEFSDIGMQAKVASGRVAVRVDANDLALLQEQDHYRGHLAMVVTHYFKDGRQPETNGSTMDLDLTAKQFETAKAEGISLGAVPVKDKATKVQVIMVDRTTHNIGSLTINVTINVP